MGVFIYPTQHFSTMAAHLRNMMMPVRFLNGIKSQIRCLVCDAHDFLLSLWTPSIHSFDGRWVPPILADSDSTYRWEGGRDEFLDVCLSCSSICESRSLNTTTTACTLAGVASQSALGISIPAMGMMSLMAYTLTDSHCSNSNFFVKR